MHNHISISIYISIYISCVINHHEYSFMPMEMLQHSAIFSSESKFTKIQSVFYCWMTR